MGFLNFCFEQFVRDRSVANLMMLTIDVCFVLNCFLFEKFYLHYALCDFDSILLQCTKLFIRQSINREQIFDVTFQIPPIEKSCVRHCERKSLFNFVKRCRASTNLWINALMKLDVFYESKYFHRYCNTVYEGGTSYSLVKNHLLSNVV